MLTITEVKTLMERYGTMREELTVLEYRIATFSKLQSDEAIECMTFAKPTGEHVQTNSYADITMRIAMNYRHYASAKNDQALAELCHDYLEKKQELDMLDYCIGMLKEPYAGVIRAKYVDNLSTQETCERFAIAKSSVHRYREKALDQLARYLAHLGLYPEVADGTTNVKNTYRTQLGTKLGQSWD